MMDTGLGAVIFLTFCMIAVFSLGAFLVYRVMNRPGTHIGSRLPKEDETNPDAEAGPGTDDHPGRGQGRGPDPR